MEKKKNVWLPILLVCSVLLAATMVYFLEAKIYESKPKTVVPGVFVENMNLAGMSKEELQLTIAGYSEAVMAERGIHLLYESVADQVVSATEMGAFWCNPEVVDEALQYGNTGTLLKRYLERKSLEEKPINLGVSFNFDKEVIAAYLEEAFAIYDTKVLEPILSREDGAFQVVEGVVGHELDIEASADKIIAYLKEEWDRGEANIALKVVVTNPKGSYDELAEVKDLLGTFTSSYSGAAANKVTNIKNGERLIDGILMYPGDEFSFDAYAAPYTIDNGYAVGQAYESGRLVDSVGGGICQVSSTLYNAVLRAELEITMRYNHSMIVGYVPISSDATLAETSGKDFRFRNNFDTPIYIEAYTTKDHKLVVNIYGKETRPSNRTVEYISETLEVINPPADVIKTDATLPVGHIEVSSAYTGYKARLWKVVKVDGEEVSKELVNNSNYRAVAKMATVGMSTTDPAVLQMMNEAVATGNIDHVKNVIGSIQAR